MPLARAARRRAFGLFGRFWRSNGNATHQGSERRGADVLGRRRGGPLGELHELLDEKTSIATIEQALASGVKVFDSSPHYGNGLAEARMGAGLRRAKRDEILVSTKIGRIMDPFTKPPKPRSDVVSPGFAGGHPHAPRFDYSYDGAMRSIEHSLLRTGLDRLDIVLIHDCDVWTHGKEEAPARFKEAMAGSLSRARQAASTRRSSRRSALASTKPTPASNSPRPVISTSR